MHEDFLAIIGKVWLVLTAAIVVGDLTTSM